MKERVYSGVKAGLQEDLDRLSHSIENCPLYPHVLGGGSGKDANLFYVGLTKSKTRPMYEMYRDSNTLACAVCRILDDTYMGCLMMSVELRESKPEFGKPNDYERRHWYNQRWRYESFVMEIDARPLWNLLERSVDFEKLGLEMAQEVSEA